MTDNNSSKYSPFYFTKNLIKTLERGCNTPSYNKSCTNNCWEACDDCIWMCLPCSFTLDVITFIPFLGISSFHKCKNNQNQNQTQTNTNAKPQIHSQTKKSKPIYLPEPEITNQPK